jgi:hypothetical protein
MAVHYLLRAKIEAKARAKPKEGLGICFSLFRPFFSKTDIRGNGFKKTEITMYIFTGPQKPLKEWSTLKVIHLGGIRPYLQK